MKSVIKTLLREGLLSEKLANVDDDVNMLYNTYFKKIVDKINKTGMVSTSMLKKKMINTSVLKSEDSIKAHNINPCNIQINAGYNFYYPKSNYISISINLVALKAVLDVSNGNIWKAEEYYEGISKEFSEERVKGSIHHELAHWIDDSLHNKHITKMLDKAIEDPSKKAKGNLAYTKKYEIEALIHNIKQLHNKYHDKWDELKFFDMLKLVPSILNTYETFSEKDKKQWVRNMKSRMYREGLLGKNMFN